MKIDLNKRKEAAGASIEKIASKAIELGKNLGDSLAAQVILVMDYSGSMRERYHNGEVQEIAESVLALTLTGLDDDGKVPTIFFDNTAHKPVVITEKDYEGFVDRWRKKHEMGGTDYGNAITAVIEYCKKEGYFKPKQPPVFVIFITDGEPSDLKHGIIRQLADAAKLPIFWQFIGLGYSPEFLRQLDTMTGRTVDNVGLLDKLNGRSIQQLKGVEPSVFFDGLLAEFIGSWLPEARRLGILQG